MSKSATDATGKRPTLLRLPRMLLRGSLCIVILMIVAGYGDSVHPMLDLLSNFQFQYFFACAFLTMALWLINSKRWGVVALLCTIPPAASLLPWYLPQNRAIDETYRPVLRVMQFNILEPNTQYGAVIDEVLRHAVDVVVFQEVDQRWNLELEQLADVLPHAVFQPAGNLRGNLVHSRHPMSNVIFEPSIGEENAPSLSATVHVNQQPVSLLVAHTVPPHDAQFSEMRNRELVRVAQRARELPKPLVVLGDFNTGMWSPHYRAFERSSELHNARRGFGVVNTFPMDGYAILRVPLDHCFVSRDIAVTSFRRGNPCGSDHAPIIADLALPSP